ncbi:MAG: hypothetical protein Q8916_13020 [Bacteroidota bacterium]|nr:hypothetical protein [Bacteroidota bacterium]
MHTIAALRPYFKQLPLAALLLAVCLASAAYAQKTKPLASEPLTVSQYEGKVLSGSLLSHEDSILIALGQAKGMFSSLPAIAVPYGKCGTELAFAANATRDKFSKPLRTAILQSAALLSDSVVSPSGKFTIYFDKSGVNAITDEYLDSVKHFADEAYQLEIVELGYAKPPYGFADSTWHIELRNLGAGTYGVTNAIGNPFGSSPSGLSKYYSYVTIDNNFDTGYTTLGLDAARITIFHEFHHVIQYGSYGTNLLDVAFREMTAVWFEMRSTPWAPDYIQYVPSYTGHFDESFDHIENIGYYGQCIWMQYLSRKFGDDILRKVWDFFADKHADFLIGFDSILAQENTNFCSEYKRFGTAVYYTGRNFQGTSIFPDARKFNQDAIRRIVLTPNVDTSIQALPASLNIFTCGYGKDTSVIVISRSTDRAYTSDASVTSKTVLTFQDSFQFPETFCDTISLPILVATKIFPQPFIISPSGDAALNILVSTDSKPPADVSLSIYGLDNTLMRHFDRSFSLSKQTQAADPFGGSWYVEWDGRDDTGRLAPSGIYQYSLEINGQRENGKFVVLRKN